MKVYIEQKERRKKEINQIYLLPLSYSHHKDTTEWVGDICIIHMCDWNISVLTIYFFLMFERLNFISLKDLIYCNDTLNDKTPEKIVYIQLNGVIQFLYLKM